MSDQTPFGEVCANFDRDWAREHDLRTNSAAVAPLIDKNRPKHKWLRRLLPSVDRIHVLLEGFEASELPVLHGQISVLNDTVRGLHGAVELRNEEVGKLKTERRTLLQDKSFHLNLHLIEKAKAENAEQQWKKADLRADRLKNDYVVEQRKRLSAEEELRVLKNPPKEKKT